MKKTIALLLLLAITFSCNEDMDDNTTPSASVNFKFTHNWNNTAINSTNLDTETVTNANGEVINMVRFRYLTSRFLLTNLSGQTYSFDGFKFSDLALENTYNFSPEINEIPTGTYTLSFIWGFNEADNIAMRTYKLNLKRKK